LEDTDNKNKNKNKMDNQVKVIQKIFRRIKVYKHINLPKIVMKIVKNNHKNKEVRLQVRNKEVKLLVKNKLVKNQ
jgi:hypothetical protein